MGMSPYNRENPFMYLLETKMDELQMKSQQSVKDMIVTGLTGAISYISVIICQILDKRLDIIPLIVLPLLVIFCIIQVRQAISSIKTKEMNKRIFGDAYKNINLNNEELLSDINNYNVSIGNVEYVIEYEHMMTLTYLVILALNIIKIMIHIFS